MSSTSHLAIQFRGLRDSSYLAIVRWRLVSCACIGLIALAWVAWRIIPRAEDPPLDPSEAVVTLAYPGASADEVDRQVVDVLDDALLSLEGLDHLDSIAEAGLARFSVKLTYGTAMDAAVERIRGKLAVARVDLPAQVREPRVVKLSTESMPQMLIGVVSPAGDRELRIQAERVAADLEQVPGVSGTDLVGSVEQSAVVRIDGRRLVHHGLSTRDIRKQIEAATARIPAGEIESNGFSLPLLTRQALSTEADLANLPVKSSSGSGAGRLIRLRDVADVSIESSSGSKRFVIDGKPAVGIALRFRRDVDIVEVARQIRKRLGPLAESVVGGGLEVVYDKSVGVAQSLHEFGEALLLGMVLVLAVVAAAMGIRAGALVATALPLSVAGAICGLYVLGYSVEQVSLAGLIVAIGLLVDDAVVVAESVQLMRDRGLGAVRAAVFGTSRVFRANVGTTAVACSSFVPLFFLGGTTGAFIEALPVAVVLALATSMLVAQYVTPWLSTLMLRSSGSQETPDAQAFDRENDSAEVGHAERSSALRWLKATYLQRIHGVLQHPIVVIAVATAALALAVVAIPRIGVEFFPKAEKPNLFVAVTLPPGSTRDATAESLALTLQRINEEPGVEHTSAVLGGGYPRLFIGRAGPGDRGNVADILIQLAPGFSSEQLAGNLRRRLTDIVGARVSVQELYQGPPVEHPVGIRIYGEDEAVLARHVEPLEELLRAQPGAIDVSDTLTQSSAVATWQVNAERAALAGLTTSDIGTSLRTVLSGDEIARLSTADEQLPIILLADEDEPLEAQQVAIPGVGMHAPLRSLGELRVERSFSQIRRRDGQRFVEVTADLDGSNGASGINAAVDRWLKAHPWEPGYGFAHAGARAAASRSYGHLALASAGAALLMFVLLLWLFDSYQQALTVAAALPYALIGPVVALAITGQPFGFMSFTGLIALLGVYVNHKLYFVDRVLELRRRGADLRSAIVNAGVDRIRPVILTALTAALGLLPLTLGSSRLWAQFGWVNIFGLLFSVPLSLVLLPAMMMVAERLRIRIAHPRARAQTGVGSPATADLPTQGRGEFL
jgi:multidrug efflux pump subunit AcrB